MGHRSLDGRRSPHLPGHLVRRREALGVHVHTDVGVRLDGCIHQRALGAAQAGLYEMKDMEL